MKHNLKSAWAIALITLLSAGCKKESEILLQEKRTANNLISDNTGSKSKTEPVSTKLFPWESADAAKTRQNLKSMKKPYAVSLINSSTHRELRFENSSTLASLKSITLRAFYKYAKHFKINEPWSKQAEEKFIKALESHMKDPNNNLIRCVIDDKKTLSSMINIYDHRTGLNVELTKPLFKKTIFHAVAKLNPNQANELAISGRWPSIGIKQLVVCNNSGFGFREEGERLVLFCKERNSAELSSLPEHKGGKKMD